MIITILNQGGFAGNARLARSLATLRAHAGRNVLFIETCGVESTWKAVEIKLGAIAYPIDRHFESTLWNSAPRYHDIVIDAGMRDSPGNRSAVLINTPVCDRTAVQEIPGEGACKPLNDTSEHAAMSRLYRSIFVTQ